jgi:hypothetical protein
LNECDFITTFLVEFLGTSNWKSPALDCRPHFATNWYSVKWAFQAYFPAGEAGSDCTAKEQGSLRRENQKRRAKDPAVKICSEPGQMRLAEQGNFRAKKGNPRMAEFGQGR